MLLPALNKAREKAKQITCVNNFKNISLASSYYTDDYDGYIVPINTYALGDDSKPGNGDTWIYFLYSYLENRTGQLECFICPSRTEYGAWGARSPGNYGMNAQYFYNIMRKAASIRTPSLRIIFSEPSSTASEYVRSPTVAENKIPLEFRHNNYAVLDYCDGHAMSENLGEANISSKWE
jgi:hypothetical protein